MISGGLCTVVPAMYFNLGMYISDGLDQGKKQHSPRFQLL